MAKRGGFPGGIPGNMNNLMKQAQRMQRQMEEAAKELETREYTASAGGGAVSVTVSGKKEVVSVKLSPDAVDPDDIEMLEDLIAAAVNEAFRQMEADNSETMSKLTGASGNRRKISSAPGISHYQYAQGAGGGAGGSHAGGQEQYSVL